MPKKKNIDPTTLPTPLAPILPNFVRSPAIVAPKLAEPIQRYVAKARLRVEVNDSPVSFGFSVHTDRRIRTSIHGLEHLWGSLYAYQTLYDLTKVHQGQLFDLTSTSEGRIAREFLLWAFDANPALPWPAGLPKPIDTGLGTVAVTNNLFTFSCGFILLHEIGHEYLGHLKQPATNPDTKIRREYAADAWAIETIVNGTEPSDLAPRMVAIAATLGVIGGVELYGDKDDKRVHPFPTDRIQHFGEKMMAATSDTSVHAAALLAAGVPIQAHLLRKGVETMRPHQSFKEFFEEAKSHYPS